MQTGLKVSAGQAWLLQEPTDGLSADDVASKGMNQTESGLNVPFGGVARPRRLARVRF